MKKLILSLSAALLITAAGSASAFWGNNWGGWNPYDPWDPRFWAEEFFGGGWGGYGGGPWGYGGGPWGGYGGYPYYGGGYYGGPWGGYGGYPYYAGGYYGGPWGGYGVPYLGGYGYALPTTAQNNAKTKAKPSS
jgi:hypothetical protein